ncbi:MAG TPA: WbqC family protein [Nitrospira sp.]|jgi:WbqC-like protein family|nr:WbqC family protein [Nitrospira sp.]
MKTAVIRQPDFLPYLGIFHRLLHADLFVLLDHVQFVAGTSHSWTHRDKIKTPRGAQWLTVSVCRPPLGTPINAVELSRTDWRSKNLNLVRENYRTAGYFEEMFPELEKLYALPCTKLVDFTSASIDMLLRVFDISVPCVFSNSLQPVGHKNELLVDLLQKVGATHYLSGVGARDYFDPAPFRQAGIEVVWQEFKHPIYPQLYGDFVPYLSSIDLLFNCGIERSRQILRAC